MPSQSNPSEPTRAEAFDAALAQILSVSKVEILRREAEAKKQREAARDARQKARQHHDN
jgi:hypothetical protein